MKKFIAMLLALLICAVPAMADEAELLERIEQLEERVAALEALLNGGAETGLAGLEQTAYEAVAACAELPKNAEVTYAAEYYGYYGEHQLHLLLVTATQSEDMEMMYGTASKILLVDLTTGTVYSHKDIVFPEDSEPANYEEALYLAFSAFMSYVEFMPEHIWSDSEILLPMDGDAIARINGALLS